VAILLGGHFFFFIVRSMPIFFLLLRFDAFRHVNVVSSGNILSNNHATFNFLCKMLPYLREYISYCSLFGFVIDKECTMS
jgi:hypothetical protein